ncbi:hypothetical protein [Acinetobacter sp. A2]|uniref:hypothetical protein n=1 Tax=Acinetobacter sp. A2 TaxID=362457 RepID=UPI003AF37C63
MKFLFFLLGLLVSFGSYANNSFFCLSNGGKNTLLVPSTYPDIKVVQYYPYLKDIKISKPIKVKEIDMGDEFKPEIHKTVNEIINNKVTGQYTFISQGYILYGVEYLNFRNKKKTFLTYQNLSLNNIVCL